MQPQTVKTPTGICNHLCRQKDWGGAGSDNATPSPQCSNPTSIPSSSLPVDPVAPGHPHHQGTRSLCCPSTDHLTPATLLALQFSPAWTYSSVALEMVLRYCQLRAARSMAQDR